MRDTPSNDAFAQGKLIHVTLAFIYASLHNAATSQPLLHLITWLASVWCYSDLALVASACTICSHHCLPLHHLPSPTCPVPCVSSLMYYSICRFPIDFVAHILPIFNDSMIHKYGSLHVNTQPSVAVMWPRWQEFWALHIWEIILFIMSYETSDNKKIDLASIDKITQQ